jgi:putative membrane protein
MIEYDRTSWWRTCLSLHGTVLPYVLGRVGVLTGLCLALCILDDFYLQRKDISLPALDQLGHTVLGVAVGMVIVFRTNAAYGRFWEARTLWGALVNSSRSLVRMGAVFAAPADGLARLVAAYVLAIKQNLRDDADLSALRPLLSGWLYDRLKLVRNPPTELARALSEWVQERRQQGRIDSITAMALDRLVTELVAAQGGCERIRRTPLPFVYASLIKLVLLLYLGSLPLVLVARMGYAAPLVVAVVSFGLLGIEEAGVEIEDPFGRGPNHLALDQICENIARDTAFLAEERTV